MKIYDISLSISPDLPVWPGDPPIELETIASMELGRDANVSHLRTGVHIGTHVDAPHHFLNDGRTVEKLPLEVLIGPTRVVRVPDEVDVITAEVLQAADIPEGSARLLFRTRNSELWRTGEPLFQEDFVAIAADGAEWLVAHGARLVGVDYLSVAPFRESVPTHRILLSAGVVAVEGLDLHAVPPGEYALYCLPLKLVGSEGAPARAILVE
jgi:arylformamidase